MIGHENKRPQMPLPSGFEFAEFRLHGARDWLGRETGKRALKVSGKEIIGSGRGPSPALECFGSAMDFGLSRHGVA